MAYQKELRKVKILGIVGILLAVTLSIYVTVTKGPFPLFDSGTLGVLITVVCYPIGIVYGWRKMLGYATYTEPHMPADRYYTSMERTIFKNKNLMAIALRIGLTICLGWIYGVYQAIRTLRYLKKQEIHKSY